MSEEKVDAEEELQPPAIGGTFLTMMFMLWIIINPDLRDFMGESAGSVLEPELHLTINILYLLFSLQELL